MVKGMLARAEFTAMEARAVTQLVEEFVNAKAELDKEYWRDRFYVTKKSNEERNNETN